MEEENMSVEKENFIKEKTEKYGNRKEESIKELKKVIKGLVFIIVSAIVLMYCLLKGTYELGTFFLIIYLGFAAKLLLDINVSKLNDRKKINKTIDEKEISEMDMYDICINEYRENYKNLEIIDDIDCIDEDFNAIIEYDELAEANMIYTYDLPYDSLIDWNKIEFNKKDVYLTQKLFQRRTGKTVSYYKYINVFTKLNINKRFHLKTNEIVSKDKSEKFEDVFVNFKERIMNYDLENFKELNDNLNEEFYHMYFSENTNAEYLELEKISKKKLVDIYNKYNVSFSIALKDNLFRLHIKNPINSSKNDFGFAYDMKKTIEEILELFIELENIEDRIRLSDFYTDYSKVKNIILDLDNTIILDTEEDSEFYREALINAGFADDYFYGIYQAIDEYDKILTEDEPYYDENKLLEFINEYLGQEFNLDVIKNLKEVAGREWTKRVIIPEDVMEYLSSKYNLYVYTNYFQDVQEARIENIGYSKYFKKIFGADKYGCKQFKKCFEKVLSEINAKAEECIMIGDDKSRDIVAANNVKMKSLLYDYNNKRDKKEIKADNYCVIKNMNELKKIL